MKDEEKAEIFKKRHLLLCNILLIIGLLTSFVIPVFIACLIDASNISVSTSTILFYLSFTGNLSIAISVLVYVVVFIVIPKLALTKSKPS